VSALAALRNRGVQAGLASAVLFGVAAPLAALLLGSASPWMVAALLYLGSGVGLSVLRLATRAPRPGLPRADVPWLGGAILAGGVLAPVLLMLGLTGMPASSASLLLTAEGVFTAVIAWVAFRENVDRRVLLGFGAILAGVVLLAWQGEVGGAALWPTAAVLGACLLWGVDNNLTRRVSLHDATWLAAVKGWVAGSVNLVLALMVGGSLPTPGVVVLTGMLGLLSYGISLALFVVALRGLGTARAGAYFSVAPFVGALLAVLLGDPVTWQLVAAGLLIALGVWLHLTERHDHAHVHAPVVHAHPVIPDEHHAGPPAAQATEHTHSELRHDHPHYPDAHHRHEH
jgi:drug/metabolite transporter (DMT)-like permease